MRIFSLCLILLCSTNTFAQDIQPTTKPEVPISPEVKSENLANTATSNFQTSKDQSKEISTSKNATTSVPELIKGIKEGTLLPHEAFEGEIFDTTHNNHQTNMTYCTDYSNVKHLTIETDDFEDISETKLKTFFALESLSIVNFDTMRTKAGKKLQKKILTLLSTTSKLRYLRLYHVNLEKFPDEICNLKYLSELNIEDKKIPTIPAEIGNLKNLKRLMIKCNRITNLPQELGNLTALEHLYLKCNCLTKIPSSIGNLVNLKYLNLHCRELEMLPPEVKNLTNLKHINCADSQISSFTVGGNPRNVVVETSRRFSVKRICRKGFDLIKSTLSCLWHSISKKLSGNVEESNNN